MQFLCLTPKQGKLALEYGLTTKQLERIQSANSQFFEGTFYLKSDLNPKSMSNYAFLLKSEGISEEQAKALAEAGYDSFVSP